MILSTLPPDSFFNPVVFFSNSVGDHIMFLPALRALADIFPNRLTLVLLPNVYSEFFVNIKVKKIITLESSKFDIINWNLGTQKGDLQNFDFQILANKIGTTDLFISANIWHSPSLLGLIDLLEPRVSIGFHPNYTCYLPVKPIHEFDLYFLIPQLFLPSIKLTEYSKSPEIENKYLQLAKSLKENMILGGKILIVHSDTKKKKMWVDERFTSVINSFLNLNPNYLVIIIGLKHSLMLENVTMRDHIEDFCGLPLGLSFALIGIADLYLGIDSCMLHIADLLRVPGVGLFGPTNPNKWGFKYSPHIHIWNKDLDSIESHEVVDSLLKLDSQLCEDTLL